MKLSNVGIANLCVSNKIKSSYFNNDLINESKESASDFLMMFYINIEEML